MPRFNPYKDEYIPLHFPDNKLWYSSKRQQWKYHHKGERYWTPLMNLRSYGPKTEELISLLKEPAFNDYIYRKTKNQHFGKHMKSKKYKNSYDKNAPPKEQCRNGWTLLSPQEWKRKKHKYQNQHARHFEQGGLNSMVNYLKAVKRRNGLRRLRQIRANLPKKTTPPPSQKRTTPLPPLNRHFHPPRTINKGWKK